MSTGRLTTHVLDTGLGRPAAGLRIALYKIRGEARALLQEVVTNEGGRTDAALLSGPELIAGEYELLFHAGDYLRTSGQAGAGTLFLDKVPVRFGISDPGMHIHVPLLLSPYGYSTYRGS